MKKVTSRVVIVAVLVSVLIWIFSNLEPISRIPSLGFNIPYIPLIFLWIGLAISPLVRAFVISSKKTNKKEEEVEEAIIKSVDRREFKTFKLKEKD